MDVVSLLTLLCALLAAAAAIFAALRAGAGQRLAGDIERTERALRSDLATARAEQATQGRDLRDELGLAINRVGQGLELRQETLRQVVEQRLDVLRKDNTEKLEEMRKTVDEKLEGTLEKRLGESFKLVSERLEQVHKGLGEMQTLAGGVGDLKRVLSNVKTRGVWGEIQLGRLLEQMLSPDQYMANAICREGSQERVEFAVRLPGADEGSEVLLPIDAKFPSEDYERLVEASEQADAEGVERAATALEARVRLFAKEVNSKYINPPRTTNFAILFLPTEGLFAELLRRPGLVDRLQREYRVTLCGPTTLSAFLNSLQLGFSTLAIQKRFGDIQDLLSAVKTEFGRYGEVLDKVQKKLHEASTSIDQVAVRKRAIDRRLREVGEITGPEASRRLELPAPEDTLTEIL